MLFWAIWMVKNAKLLGEVPNPDPIADFLRVTCSLSQPVSHGVSPRWLCPPIGRLKLNVDWAWDKEHCIRGVGIIIRNAEGNFVGAATRVFMEMFSPIQVEALAMRVGLELVVERGLIKINIESDALHIVLAVLKSSMNSSPMGPIIEDTKFLLALVVEASVAHIHPQANLVAHHLARFALHSRGNYTWFNEPPLIISDLLVGDVSLPCTN
ncbi:hypothetical protein D8674_022343 [Pyrus ussuriensis x Pyrus communis]|uniref:RNase H type-1 domain-containing protein n=1 Tax=Pyrus ussuriensis x Pyrus communis TaxID=2448454 RepID=A0A5N5GJP1_9ROSA|nr:hypothetical protein D8674_022343 [Pyrus ussuriensis x Pyrus communis]